jgi:two-component system sensor histidine kinase ArlS
MKLVYKINLLFAAIVSAIVLVIAFFIYTISRQTLQNDYRQRLKTRAARTAQLYTFFRSDTTNLLKSLDANAPPALFNKNINIYDEQLNILYEYHDEGTNKIIPLPEKISKAAEDGQVFYTIKGKEVCLFYHKDTLMNLIVLVAADNLAGKEYIRSLKKIFLLFIPGAVIIALAAGYLFSRSIIRPVKETISDVELITSQNLSHRLFEGDRKDELSQLNATFNDLLNRLEESFAIQRRFISNASHELSTPLTSVSSQIEVSLLQDRSPEEYRHVLKSVLDDVKELHQLTHNLLEIAKAGTDGGITLNKVRIDEVLIKVHSDFLRQHKDYRTELFFEELPENENECLVFGNYHLLHSAFKNLLENGCKYSPDASVKVNLSFRKQEVIITFKNNSDMLTNEEISKLFEPFYRGSNARGKQGTGLGLTLTKRIIGLHKGTLTVHSTSEQGTVLVIRLPTLKK